MNTKKKIDKKFSKNLKFENKKYINTIICFFRDVFKFLNIMRKLYCCKYVKIKFSYVVYIFDKIKQNFL